MEDQWAVPPPDSQHRDVILPTAELPGPAVQANIPTYQQGEDPIIQNCSCPQCSALRGTQAGPQTWYLVEQQDPRQFGMAGTPYLDQGQDVAPPQTARIQNNFGYRPPNVGLVRASTLNASIAEGRRRLAGHYLNNPEAYVSTIHLEPGPSGQFQVIITLEMAMTNVVRV